MTDFKTKIIPIFDEVYEEAAAWMLDHGRAHRIEADEIAEGIRYSESGQTAKFAMIFTNQHAVAEFIETCKTLRKQEWTD